MLEEWFPGEDRFDVPKNAFYHGWGLNRQVRKAKSKSQTLFSGEKLRLNHPNNTCSWEPCLATVSGTLAWELCLGTCSWEPGLGILPGNLACEPVPGKIDWTSCSWDG